MTREHKLALILGFSVLMVVGLLVGDHFSKARRGVGVSGADLASESQLVNKPIAMVPEPSYPGLPGATPARVQEPAVSGAALGTLPPVILSAPRNSLLVDGDPNAAHGGGVTRLETIEPIEMGVARSSPTESPRILGLSQSESQAPSPSGRLTAEDIKRMNDELTRGQAPKIPAAGSVSGNEPKTTPPVVTSPEVTSVTSGLPISKGREQMHPVEEGETLFAISKKYYGDGGLWKDLAKYNVSRVKGDSVRQGVTLRIPPKDVLQGKASLAGNAVGAGGGSSVNPRSSAGESKPLLRAVQTETRDSGLPTVTTAPDKKVVEPKPAKPVVAKGSAGTYTVKPGDTLSKIAAGQLGSAKRADDIVKANSATLEDPDALRVGMVLKMPAK